MNRFYNFTFANILMATSFQYTMAMDADPNDFPSSPHGVYLQTTCQTDTEHSHTPTSSRPNSPLQSPVGTTQDSTGEVFLPRTIKTPPVIVRERDGEIQVFHAPFDQRACASVQDSSEYTETDHSDTPMGLMSVNTEKLQERTESELEVLYEAALSLEYGYFVKENLLIVLSKLPEKEDKTSIAQQIIDIIPSGLEESKSHLIAAHIHTLARYLGWDYMRRYLDQVKKIAAFNMTEPQYTKMADLISKAIRNGHTIPEITKESTAANHMQNIEALQPHLLPFYPPMSRRGS